MSLQGESTFSGLPCIFIRLSGCNLRCSYCDSTYALVEGDDLTTEEIVCRVKEFNPIKLVEITGGEPLMHNGVYTLIRLLQEHNYQILLETNGSISLHLVPDAVHKIVDVKCPGSAHGDSFLMSNLNYLTEKDNLKFVLVDEEDYRFAKSFLSQLKIQPHNVIFSAVWGKLPLEKLADWIVEDRLNIRMQVQLHKIIWPAEKRGV